MSPWLKWALNVVLKAEQDLGMRRRRRENYFRPREPYSKGDSWKGGTELEDRVWEGERQVGNEAWNFGQDLMKRVLEIRGWALYLGQRGNH